MSHTYYYLASSLPFLSFGKEPSISYHHFLSECKRIMPQSDYEIIHDAQLFPTDYAISHNVCLNDWNQFCNHCCNEMARFRASRAGKNPLDYLKGDISLDPFIADTIIEASKAKDPLLGEMILDEKRWEYLETLSAYHVFDLEFLVIYALKLQILERHAAIASLKGQEIFEDLKKTSLAIVS